MRIDEGIYQMNQFLKNYSVKDGVGKEWVYYRLARLHRHKNDKELANKYIKKAIAMKDEFTPALEEQKRINKMSS